MNEHDRPNEKKQQPQTDTKRPTPPGGRPAIKVPAPREPPHHSGNGQRVSWTDVEDSSPSGKIENPSAVPAKSVTETTKSEEDDVDDDDEEESDGEAKPASSIRH
jgi:hypothetical protein